MLALPDEAPTSTSVRKERHHALDLIRGLAALSVVNYHFLLERGFPVQSMGTFAVYLFFTLSAVTLLMVYGDRFRDGIDPGSCAAFYRNRVARLMPLLAAVAFIAMLYALLKQSSAELPLTAFLTGTGLMGLHLPGFLSNFTGAWSIGIEAAFYAVFPVVAIAGTRASLRTLLLAAGVLILAQQALLFLIRDFDALRFWQFYISPLAFAPFFAFGFIIYRLPKRQISIWPALALLSGLLSFSLIYDGDLLRSPLLFLLLTFAAGATVMMAWWAHAPARISGFVGDISYSLYLTYWMVLSLAEKVIEPVGMPMWIEWPVYVIICMAVAWAVFQWFEKPMRKLMRKQGSGITQGDARS
jgi:peptidoglycan/LPS O-acetylase OafA/YrhL